MNKRHLWDITSILSPTCTLVMAQFLFEAWTDLLRERPYKVPCVGGHQLTYGAPTMCNSSLWPPISLTSLVGSASTEDPSKRIRDTTLMCCWNIVTGRPSGEAGKPQVSQGCEIPRGRVWEEETTRTENTLKLNPQSGIFFRHCSISHISIHHHSYI